jgi:hypothetical protein
MPTPPDDMVGPEDYDLTQPFELFGDWWRAGPEKGVSTPGCLSFTPAYGLQLQLYGKTAEGFDQPTTEDSAAAPIWGEVVAFAGRRVPVSLFHEIHTNRPNDPAVLENSTPYDIYFVNQAIIGAHLLARSQLLLQMIELSVVDFESFVGGQPLKPSAAPFGVGYEPTKVLEAKLHLAGFTASIGSSAHTRHRVAEPQFEIAFRYVLQLKPLSPTSFDDCLQLAMDVANLLSLFSVEPVAVRRICGTSEAGCDIGWFAPMRGRNRVRTNREWVLRLSDVGASEFGGLLDSWLGLSKTMGFISSVYFSELSSPSPVTDARFFYFAACLEAFHREVVQGDIGKFLPKPVYKGIVRDLMTHAPTDLPEPLKRAMFSALSYANDKTFAERLDELFSRLEGETRKLIADDPQRFLAAVKHSRNKLAHVEDGKSHETFTGRQYAHANFCLKAWITVLILKHCGVDEGLLRSKIESVGYTIWGPFAFDSDATVSR